MLTALRHLRPPLASLMAMLFALGLLAGGSEAQVHEGVETRAHDATEADDPVHDHGPVHDHSAHGSRSGDRASGVQETRPLGSDEGAAGHDSEAGLADDDRHAGDDRHADEDRHAGEDHHADHGCNGCACVAAGCSAPAVPSTTLSADDAPKARAFGLRPATAAPGAVPGHEIFRPPRS